MSLITVGKGVPLWKLSLLKELSLSNLRPISVKNCRNQMQLLEKRNHSRLYWWSQRCQWIPTGKVFTKQVRYWKKMVFRCKPDLCLLRMEIRFLDLIQQYNGSRDSPVFKNHYVCVLSPAHHYNVEPSHIYLFQDEIDKGVGRFSIKECGSAK